MNDKLVEKINQFLSKELFHKMGDIAIFKYKDGTYELFNKYCIVEEKGYYVIKPKRGIDIKNFSSLRNAVTWCSFDNRNKLIQANRIAYLDTMISGLDANIVVHKHLISRSKDLENKLIYIAKMSEEQAKKKHMVEEMSSFITESKNWQTRKFATK